MMFGTERLSYCLEWLVTMFGYTSRKIGTTYQSELMGLYNNKKEKKNDRLVNGKNSKNFITN